MSTLEQNIRQTLDLLLPEIQKRHQESPDNPIILGITGLQGSGKSTWAAALVRLLTQEHGLYSITVSLDDFYKTHSELEARRDKDPENKLYRTRGQPGTHDEHLAQDFFRKLREAPAESSQQQQHQQVLKIPSFDKSRFNGAGDRAPESQWPLISRKPAVVVFEGWCLGFQPVSASLIEEKHSLATQGRLPINTPAQHKIPHLLEVNECLKRYCASFMGPQHFDFFVHIDTEDLRNVYRWRLEQERKLREERGEGMTDDEVRAFVDGYMPSYEIYLDQLREGLFGEKGRMVRVVLDVERRVVKREVL